MKVLIVCILAGLGAGLGTGFAGMSAAVVITPMLVTFLGMNPFEAIGIALASDVLASAISAYTYGKNKNIAIKRSMPLFISVILFTFIGAFIAHLFPPATMGNFSLWASLMIGISFIRKSFKPEEIKEEKEYSNLMKVVMPVICGIFIGLMCGFIGAGGGIAMLIALTSVLKYDLKTAVGTSVFIMTFTALFGALSHFALSSVIPDLKVLSLCVISTLIFAQLGSRYANNSNPRQLNRATGIVLTTLGLFMLIGNSL